MAPTNGASTGGNGNNGHNHDASGTSPRRAEWIVQRKAANKSGNFSQMHYARKGVVTEEMEYVGCVKSFRRNW